MANKTIQIHPRMYMLDTLINQLYDMVYGNSDEYQTIFLDASDLSMNRFKMPSYNLDTIFDGEIQYIKTMPTGIDNVNALYFKRIGTSKDTTIEIVEYADKYVVNNINNSINVNKVIRTLLSELVVNKKTKHVILPIINVDATGVELAKYNFLTSLVDTNKIYSISITEHFYKKMRLDHLLSKIPLDTNVIEDVIFWIVNVLYNINLTYPKFKCNNLFPEMIDCYMVRDKGTIFPYIKLSNFYLAEIDDIINNDYDGIPEMGSNYPYNDLYQFLNSFWDTYKEKINEFPNIVKLFDSFLPKKIRDSGMKFLTIEMWNSLSDNEKNDLNIRNIRTKLTEFYKNIEKQNEEYETARVNPQKEEEESDINIDDINEIEMKDFKNQSDDSENESSSDSDSENNPENDISEKKSNNNDIVIMSKKNTDKSRIINVTDSDIVNPSYSDRKHKTYRSTRYINPPDSSFDQSRIHAEPEIPYPNPGMNPNSGMNPNPGMNSIGQFLGTNSGDFRMPNSSFDHGSNPVPQIPQMNQMSQMPQMNQNDMMQRYMSSLNPDYNQARMSQQQPMDPNMLAMAQQQQMDPNMLAMLQQQQMGQPQMSQPQMGMSMSQPQMGMPVGQPQMGGRYNKNFFFRR